MKVGNFPIRKVLSFAIANLIVIAPFLVIMNMAGFLVSRSENFLPIFPSSEMHGLLLGSVIMIAAIINILIAGPVLYRLNKSGETKATQCLKEINLWTAIWSGIPGLLILMGIWNIPGPLSVSCGLFLILGVPANLGGLIY